MQKITYEREYFEPQSTLGCGQTFRFRPWREGYFVCAADRACYVYARGNETFVECEDADRDYFHHYFDLSRDYGEICRRAESYGIETVCAAYRKGRGLRILNQDEEETTFSFLVSQNNHIPRIKGILERIAERAGEEKIFLGERFFTFPKASVLAEKDERFFADLGAGYRAKYLCVRESDRCGRAPRGAGKARRRPSRATDGAVRRRPESGGLHRAVRLSRYRGVSRGYLGGKSVPRRFSRRLERPREDRGVLSRTVRRRRRIYPAGFVLL